MNECQDAHKGDCEGTVEMRMTNPDTWKHRMLCQHHQEEHLKVYEHARELMNPTPASWFDPSYAGERWDDDY